MARDAGFDSAVDRVPLSVRVLQFLSSKKPTSLREVADGVGEGCDLVDHSLRRLWKNSVAVNMSVRIVVVSGKLSGNGLRVHKV